MDRRTFVKTAALAAAAVAAPRFAFANQAFKPAAEHG